MKDRSTSRLNVGFKAESKKPKKHPLQALFVLAAFSASISLAGPTKITFWHSMELASGLVQKFANDFNASQKEYQVIPESVGDYRVAENKLMGAIRAKNTPVMFQAELAFFAKLAQDGALANLEELERSLDPALRKDFYGSVWNYGEVSGKRYGLPWNVSTPVLYYNATAFRQLGLKPPKTWAEVEQIAKRLTNRNSKGFTVMAESWQFEQMVLARGGNVVKDNKPNFDSPEAVDALEMLVRMSKNKTGSPRNLGESTYAILDFVRTKTFMAVASIANWPDILPYNIAFELGVAPMPCAEKCVVPVGGAQLTVLKDASKEEQQGAFEFWKFLMKPENLKTWIESSYYVSPRKSVLPVLKDFYAGNPYRKTAFEQLDESVSRPRVADYAVWRSYLEEAIEKATKGNVSAIQALQEAQRRAEK